MSDTRRKVQLGVIEFHSERLNPGLIKRFFEITQDLTDSGSIVDVWLMDIAAVLKEFGYEMEIYSAVRPAQSTAQHEAIEWMADHGQPCRKCGSPLERQTHKRLPPPQKPGAKYYFAWWFRCANQKCGQFYMVEAAKRFY